MSSRFRFVGNAAVGQQEDNAELVPVKLQSLMGHYDSVLLAYGASQDKKLGIPGESTLSGIYSARQFVGWYNGLPDCATLEPALFKGEEAVIIGQGNVALDVARILLEKVDNLKNTDITEQALEALSRSRIKRVHVVGRRGPIQVSRIQQLSIALLTFSFHFQAAFTIKEVRELMKIPDVAFHPVDRSLIPADTKTLPRATKRMMEVILKGTEHSLAETTKSWSLDNCLSPRHFLSDSQNPTSVAGTQLNVMRLTDPFDSSSRSIATGETTIIPSDIVFRSVGYKSVPLTGFAEAGIQFDESRGIVENDGLGRVTRLVADGDGSVSQSRQVPGMYCAGWVKRGPTGVIASTMQDAFATGEAIVQDWLSGAPFLNSNSHNPSQGWVGVKQDIGSRADLSVTWEDWQMIDNAERRSGQQSGKVREKFRRTAEMLSAIGR